MEKAESEIAELIAEVVLSFCRILIFLHRKCACRRYMRTRALGGVYAPNICILQYLTSRGYLQTVASFQTELQHRPKQATPTQTTGLQVHMHSCISTITNSISSAWVYCCIWMWWKSSFFRSLEPECTSSNTGTRPDMSKPGISSQCLLCHLPHSYRGKGLTKQSTPSINLHLHRSVITYSLFKSLQNIWPWGVKSFPRVQSWLHTALSPMYLTLQPTLLSRHYLQYGALKSLSGHITNQDFSLIRMHFQSKCVLFSIPGILDFGTKISARALSEALLERRFFSAKTPLSLPHRIPHSCHMTVMW